MEVLAMSKNIPANVRLALNADVFTLHLDKMRRKAILADIDDLMNASSALRLMTRLSLTSKSREKS
jgi:hypothetical protein